MIVFSLTMVVVIGGFLYYWKDRRPKRELSVYSVLSLLGLFQLLLILIDKPLRLTSVIAAVLSLGSP